MLKDMFGKISKYTIDINSSKTRKKKTIKYGIYMKKLDELKRISGKFY